MTPDSEPAGAPRCLGCFYVLTGLTESRCPECGRKFNLNDPKTFTRKPPFLRWHFWLPGLALASGIAIALFSGMLLITRDVGSAATIAAPCSIGAILGYRCRVGPIALVGLSICAVAILIVTLVTAEISGLLCGIIAAVAILTPVIIGACLGWLLRVWLKRGEFSQRSYLPVILLIVAPSPGG